MFKTLLTAILCHFLIVPCLAHDSYVYVTNYGDGTISQFSAHQDGTLTPLKPPIVKAHMFCHSMAVARGRFLYAVSAREFHRSDCVVSQYRIDSKGRLFALMPAQIPIPGTPSNIVADPLGRFVYVFTRQNKVCPFQVGADGQLHSLHVPAFSVSHVGNIVPVVGLDAPHHVLYGSYVVGWLDVVQGGTFALAVQKSGRLRPLPRGETFYSMDEHKVMPSSICLTPNGRYAYVNESLYHKRQASEWQNVIAQYRTHSDGSLTPLSPKTVVGQASGTSLVEPAGRFMYLVYEKVIEIKATASYWLGRAPIRHDGTLGPFTYQTLGVTASLPPVQEISLTFDSTGRYCYFAEGNYVYLFRRQSDGSLASLRPTRVEAGYGPLGIACVRQ